MYLIALTKLFVPKKRLSNSIKGLLQCTDSVSTHTNFQKKCVMPVEPMVRIRDFFFVFVYYRECPHRVHDTYSHKLLCSRTVLGTKFRPIATPCISLANPLDHWERAFILFVNSLQHLSYRDSSDVDIAEGTTHRWLLQLGHYNVQWWLHSTRMLSRKS